MAIAGQPLEMMAPATEKCKQVRAKEDDDKLCVVCMENPKNQILIPCGHVCVCEACAKDIGDACPLCRKEVKVKYAAYF